MTDAARRSTLERLRRQAFAGFVATAALGAFYWFLAGLGIASGEPGLLNFAPQATLLVFVWWLRLDAIRHGYWPAYHYGCALLVAWPVLVPYHLWKVHGPRGAGYFALLVAGVAAPWAASYAGAALAHAWWG